MLISQSRKKIKLLNGRKALIFVLIFSWLLNPWIKLTPNLFIIEEVRAASDTRANTVYIYGGTYGGNGSGGQDSNTAQTLDQQYFKLAETGVDIKNAFILVEAQLDGAGDRGTVSGHRLAFDACVNSCTADAWSGSGAVLDDQSSTILQYQDSSGAIYVKLLMDVTSETQMASYIGDGSQINFQIGYMFYNALTTTLIDSVKTKLVITYTYDDSSESITNTVFYPMESTYSNNQGSRTVAMSSSCTKNSTCATFDYNMDITEFSEKISQWFEMGQFNDLNNSSDIPMSLNIQGTDIDSSEFYLEAGQSGGQGNWAEGWWSGVSGFSENTSQTAEWYFTAGTTYLIGGEVTETYIASSSATTKTKTVSFPIGAITNDISVANTDYTASTTVYLPESGVTIKKAWVRITENGDLTSTDHTIGIKTKVGNNTQSSILNYTENPPNTVFSQTAKINHVIPSSDYTELASANASTGKDVLISVQSSSTDIEGVSAELMITYTYTNDDSGYLSSLALFAGQSNTIGSSQSETLSTANSVLPENNGTKTIRAAAILASYSSSESTAVMPSGTGTYDAGLSATTPSCSNAYYSEADSANAFMQYYDLVTENLGITNNTSYSACYTNNGHGDAQTGAKMNGILLYTYQLDLPYFTQSAYRIFNNTDATDVGSVLANQDTAATLSSTGDNFRLRISMHTNNGQLGLSGENFKLQFSEMSGTCDTAFVGENYSDITGATAISFYNNPTPSDGDNLTDNVSDPVHSGHNTNNQTYEESNNFTNSTSIIPINEDGLWDFSLKDNSALTNTSYCFRIVKSDNSLLDSYSVVPQINTAINTIVSVSVSDGIINYGTISANNPITTLSGELHDTQTITNDGNLTEEFNIKGQNGSGGGCTWTLSENSGTDQYVHQFCLNKTDCTSPPTNYTALTTNYQTLTSKISNGEYVDVDFRLITPNPSSCYGEQNVDIIIQAVQP